MVQVTKIGVLLRNTVTSCALLTICQLSNETDGTYIFFMCAFLLIVL